MFISRGYAAYTRGKNAGEMAELRRLVDEHEATLRTLADEKAELLTLKRMMEAEVDAEAFEQEYDRLLRDSRAREQQQLREGSARPMIQ